MKKLILFLAAAVAAISCSNDGSLLTPSLATNNISVTVSTPSSTDSKVDLVDNGNGGYEVSWSLGDALGGWCDGVYNNGTFNEFKMESDSYSAKQATFSGSISYIDEGDNVRFVYPYSSSTALYNKDNTVDGYTTYMNAFDISLASQTAKADISHLSATTFMVSDALVYDSSESASTQENLAMRHVGSSLDLHLKLASSAGYTLTKVVVSGIPSKATINLLKEVDDVDFMTLDAQSSVMTIDVDAFEASSDIYTVVANMLPFTLNSGEAIEVVATFVDEDGLYYTATAETVAQSEVEFARASRHTIGMILGELTLADADSDSVTVAQYTFDYNTLGSSWINGQDVTLGGIEWYINSMKGYNTSGNISFSYYNSVGGSCYNKTPFGEGVTEVVIGHTSGEAVKLFVGSSENPSSTEITPTLSGSTYTYTLPEAMPYITLKNGSTTYINLSSIVVNYIDSEQDSSQGGDQSGSETVLSLDKDVLGLGAYATTTKSVDGCSLTYYLGCYDSSTIQFHKTSSYLYNTTALTDISKIVVTKSGNNNLTLYVGTSSQPSSTSITPTVVGDVSTYVVNNGSTYFSFTNSGGASNISSIEVYYWASGSAGSDGSTDGGTTDDNDSDDELNQGGDSTTTPSVGTAYSGWAELPSEISDQGNYYYAYHTVSNGTETVRNFGACYSSDYTCPVWVAGPMHTSYTGSTSRTDAYADDPQIDCYQVETLGSPYNRGHMIASSDRTASTAMNKQAFYLSNIAPQLLSYFNSGGGIWNNYEDYIQDQYESRTDTLYIVNGCHWENTNTVVETTTVPTHYYKAVLRTKQSGSSKWVGDCTSDELECVAFYFEHKSSQDDPKASHMISISDLEAKTGWTYFPNVPNAPKDSFSASDWDL